MAILYRNYEVIEMERTITSKGSVAASSELQSYRYGRNDYEATAGRNFLVAFELYIWKELLSSKLSRSFPRDF